MAIVMIIPKNHHKKDELLHFGLSILLYKIHCG